MKSPVELTKTFIASYKKWNDFAYQQHKAKTPNANLNIAKMYDDIILEFCGPDKKYQGLAYGSEANHCPEQEQILGEKTTDRKAIVCTKFINQKFSFLTHDYQYHFVLHHNNWRLEEVYLVDDNGMHICL